MSRNVHLGRSALVAATISICVLGEGTSATAMAIATKSQACKVWQVVPGPKARKSTYLLGVSTRSGGMPLPNKGIWAVGASADSVPNTYTYAESWNGTNWKVAPSPNRGSVTSDNQLDSVSMLSGSSAWAVGVDGNDHASALHWNGRAWSATKTRSPGENAELSGVSAASSKDIWTVGYDYNVGNINYGTLVEHWNGHSWSVVHSPTPNIIDSRLDAVAAISKTDAWAVGFRNVGQSDNGKSRTLIEHWNGEKWLVVPSPSVGTGDDLTGISAGSPNNIWAVGGYTYINKKQNTVASLPLIEHWNGSKWSIVHSASVSSVNATFTSVDATNTRNVWLVGNMSKLSQTGQLIDARPLAQHFNGSKWVNVPVAGPRGSTSGPWGAAGFASVTISSDSVWAVGQQPASQTATRPLIERYRIC
jgi:hypothetical protein